ncbi:hypothetical protein NA57DRAFT_75108 [Rhizodiscina lignyota]|uniref:Myb-like domain-containing protein n=1 Tax=Rhizodiscina lignyota TaxID=1504668 RepID=A0A9P4IHW7_9PEZI|nr:hypothetical protein NA57DRAFT_75108 [Rhizodiscina lignyota]
MEGVIASPNSQNGSRLLPANDPYPATNFPRLAQTPQRPHLEHASFVYPAEYNEELERDRRKNDLKLKSRFEHIFSKYGKNFAEVGDEVDLVTGELVVNNGHLQHMRNEVDLGDGRKNTWDSEDSDSSSSEEGESASEEGYKSEQVDDPDGSQSDPLDETEGYQSGSYEPSDDDVGSEGRPPIEFDDDLPTDEPTPSLDGSVDVWNDVPELPGDSRRPTFPMRSNAPAFSTTTLKQLENNIATQIAQFMQGYHQTQPSATDGQPHASSHPQPQVKIDLDPSSATYGQITFNHDSSSVAKRPLPDDGVSPTQEAAKRPKFATQASLSYPFMQTPNDVAANVARRIAAAGLPTEPGPDGRWPSYKRSKSGGRTKSGKVASGSIYAQQLEAPDAAPTTDDQATLEEETQIISEEPTEMALQSITDQGTTDADLFIDPVLLGGSSALQTAGRNNLVSAPHHDQSNPASPGSHYSANTARPLVTKRVTKPDVPFTEEDDLLIIELKDNRGMLWPDIHDIFFPERRTNQLQYRYYTYLKPESHNEFTEQDDDLIVELKETDNLTWNVIQREYFPEFSVSQLQYRYYSKLSNTDRKSRWTEEQDELLAELKDIKNLTWAEMRRDYFPGRTLGQIQYRYYNKVRPRDWKERLLELTKTAEEAKIQKRGETLSGHYGKEGKAAAAEDSDGPDEVLWNAYRRLAGASDILSESKKKRHAERKRKKAEEEERKAARKAAKQARKAKTGEQRQRGVSKKKKGDKSGLERSTRPPRSASFETSGYIDNHSLEDDAQLDSDAYNAGQATASTTVHGLGLNMARPANEPQLEHLFRTHSSSVQQQQQQREDAFDLYEHYQKDTRPMTERQRRAQVQESMEAHRQQRLLQEASKLGPMLLPKGSVSAPLVAISPNLVPTSSSLTNSGDAILSNSPAYLSPYPCGLPNKASYQRTKIKKLSQLMLEKELQEGRPGSPSKARQGDSQQAVENQFAPTIQATLTADQRIALEQPEKLDSMGTEVGTPLSELIQTASTPNFTPESGYSEDLNATPCDSTISLDLVDPELERGQITENIFQEHTEAETTRNESSKKLSTQLLSSVEQQQDQRYDENFISSTVQNSVDLTMDGTGEYSLTKLLQSQTSSQRAETIWHRQLAKKTTTKTQEQPMVPPSTQPNRKVGPKAKTSKPKTYSKQNQAPPASQHDGVDVVAASAPQIAAPPPGSLREVLMEAETHRQRASSALEQLKARGYSIGSNLVNTSASDPMHQPLPRELWAGPTATPHITIRNYTPSNLGIQKPSQGEVAPRPPHQALARQTNRQGQADPKLQAHQPLQPQNERQPPVENFVFRKDGPKDPIVRSFSTQKRSSQAPSPSGQGESSKSGTSPLPRVIQSIQAGPNISQMIPRRLNTAGTDSTFTGTDGNAAQIERDTQPHLAALQRPDSEGIISTRSIPRDSSIPDKPGREGESSATDNDASGDELTGHKELFEKTVLGMRASLSFVDTRRPRRSRNNTPVKSNRGLTPRKTPGRISSLTAKEAQIGDDAEADELA